MKDAYTIANMKKVRWGVLEENQPISLYPVMYHCWDDIIRETGKILGKPQTNIICLHQKNKGIIFVDHKEWTELGAFALKKITGDINWGSKLSETILKLSDELVSFSSKQIFRTNLKKKTNIELYEFYKEYLYKQSNMYNYAAIPVFLDLYKPHLTSYLTEYLHKQVRKIQYGKTAKECFALLTIPEKLSKVQEEERALLKIASLSGRSTGQLANARRVQLKKHIERFRYLGYNFEGPAFPDSYFQKRLKEMRHDPVSPKDKLQMMPARKKHEQLNHDRILKELKVDAKHRKLLETTRSFIYSKDYRKMSLVQSYYEMEPLLRELANRFNLPIREIRNCLLEEIKDMAIGKIKKPADLAKRMEGCLYVVIRRNLPGRVFVDERFKAMRHYLLQKEDYKEINYFHGQPACLGQARGKVKIINSVKDLTKMKKGDILVSQMTNPDLVPAMKIAAAIVTDLGGITSHAAIVSRELNVPCVIGTKIATKVLKDGDVVEVDANTGEIRKI